MSPLPKVSRSGPSWRAARAPRRPDRLAAPGCCARPASRAVRGHAWSRRSSGRPDGWWGIGRDVRPVAREDVVGPAAQQQLERSRHQVPHGCRWSRRRRAPSSRRRESRRWCLPAVRRAWTTPSRLMKDRNDELAHAVLRLAGPTGLCLTNQLPWNRHKVTNIVIRAHPATPDTAGHQRANIGHAKAVSERLQRRTSFGEDG